jgi:anti-sigma factor RsiW
MNCTEFMVELTDLLDDRLDGELRRDLDEHMQGCEHCKVVFVTTKQTIQIYRDNELYDLTPSLRERLEAVIMQRCRESGRSK